MIEFHWVEGKHKRRKELILCAKAAKHRAYELIEAERLELISNVYYTLGNITKKLDYYNECLEQLCLTLKNIKE